jgi:hypothetical protein
MCLWVRGGSTDEESKVSESGIRTWKLGVETPKDPSTKDSVTLNMLSPNHHCNGLGSKTVRNPLIST